MSKAQQGGLAPPHSLKALAKALEPSLTKPPPGYHSIAEIAAEMDLGYGAARHRILEMVELGEMDCVKADGKSIGRKMHYYKLK